MSARSVNSVSVHCFPISTIKSDRQLNTVRSFIYHRSSSIVSLSRGSLLCTTYISHLCFVAAPICLFVKCLQDTILIFHSSIRNLCVIISVRTMEPEFPAICLLNVDKYNVRIALYPLLKLIKCNNCNKIVSSNDKVPGKVCYY